jgi:peptidoglycan hydrolase CwlO-like protein
MTEDPIERNMHFLVEQQAQFSADIERLKGTQERTQQQLEANQKQLEKNQQQIYDLAGALTTVVRLYGEKRTDRGAEENRSTAGRHRRTLADLH